MPFEVKQVDSNFYEGKLQQFLPDKIINIHTHLWLKEFNAGDAFEVLADTENMMFDISANTKVEVFERLIKAVGPKRILFGSDLPSQS